MKKKLFRWLKVIIILYCIIGIAAYYLQDRLLFHPEPIARDVKYDFNGAAYTEINLPYNKETNINIIQFHAPAQTASDTPAKRLVLYFHGNMSNVIRHAAAAAPFTKKGYEVWMIDYPGFGKSTGRLTEANLYEYALLEYKLARTHYAPRDIIIYGKSIGTGVAAQLASVRDCRRLILESPYYSILSLARHYLPVYPLGAMLHWRLPINEYIPAVTAPITIFHGDDDHLIPASNAARLQPLLKSGDEFISIPGAAHNDVWLSPAYRQKIDSVL